MDRRDSEAQRRYDDLLLGTVTRIEGKADTMGVEIVKQGVELKSNTEQTRRLATEVQHTNGSVQELKGKVTNIEKVVFPENPVTKPSELPDSWIRDPQIQSLLKPALWIILALIAAYLGTKNISIPGVG